MDLAVLGVTPAKAKQFNKKEIFTVEDLVRYFPRRYIDCTHVTGILPEDEKSCIVVRVNTVRYGGNAKTKVMTALCYLVDMNNNVTDTSVKITWFNQGYLSEMVERSVHKNVFVVGKVTYNAEYNNYQICAPEVYDTRIEQAMRIYPVYSKIRGMSFDYLTEKITKGLKYPVVFNVPYPDEIAKEAGYCDTSRAIVQAHRPESNEALQEAEDRLLFDDLVYFALQNEWAVRNCPKGSAFFISDYSLYNKIRDHLPFELTPDQDKTVTTMLKNVSEGKRINALVQGDVGCGKTIVAFLMMAAFVGSGYQTVLMAPTQVLAKQHYNDLMEYVAPLGYEVAYLGSDLKAREKNAVIKKIASGEAKFVVGTHSVIGKSVQYTNLGLVIADEEHKFGVAQRSALVDKASLGVHRISMSATPIPQSLAQVLYGNMIQLHTIQSMPNGRKPVQTAVAHNRRSIYKFLYNTVYRQGHQAYIVCPLIEQNDDMVGVKSVEEVEAEYREALEPLGVRFATLTGKDSKESIEATIAAFKAHEIDVLISTTVIEVGVNVPNATAMIVTNAERFGLSSLHQLRGRVGRSALQSYCVLESFTQTEVGERRLAAMCRTTNGFEIAQEDLDIRGAGDYIGIRQSGENKYLSLMLAFPEKYKVAQNVSKTLLDKEPDCLIVKRVKQEQEADNG